MDKTLTQTTAHNGISEETRVIITLALYGKLQIKQSSWRSLLEAHGQPVLLRTCTGHAGDMLFIRTAPVFFSFSTAAKSQQASDLHSCLRKYTTSYLGSLSSTSLKYSLIKYSLAKYSRNYDTDQDSVINMLAGICYLWPVFTTIFQGTEVFQGPYVHVNYAERLKSREQIGLL